MCAAASAAVSPCERTPRERTPRVRAGGWRTSAPSGARGCCGMTGCACQLSWYKTRAWIGRGTFGGADGTAAIAVGPQGTREDSAASASGEVTGGSGVPMVPMGFCTKRMPRAAAVGAPPRSSQSISPEVVGPRGSGCGGPRRWLTVPPVRRAARPTSDGACTQYARMLAGRCGVLHAQVERVHVRGHVAPPRRQMRARERRTRCGPYPDGSLGGDPGQERQGRGGSETAGGVSGFGCAGGGSGGGADAADGGGEELVAALVDARFVVAAEVYHEARDGLAGVALRFDVGEVDVREVVQGEGGHVVDARDQQVVRAGDGGEGRGPGQQVVAVAHDGRRHRREEGDLEVGAERGAPERHLAQVRVLVQRLDRGPHAAQVVCPHFRAVRKHRASPAHQQVRVGSLEREGADPGHEAGVQRGCGRVYQRRACLGRVRLGAAAVQSRHHVNAALAQVQHGAAHGV
eukprot:1184757-Prorocentrum_minimum.AAC.1